MAIYDTNGQQLSSAYDINGSSLSSAYDVNGNVIWTSGDEPEDPYIQGRTLVFEDKFNSINTSNWGFELGRVRNNELQYYTDNGNNVSIVDNELCITAKKENYVNATWTSASLTSFGKKHFKYGRLEAKIKFPQVSGSFPAFWTLGESLDLHYYADGTWMTHNSGNWAYCGENDIVEHYTGSSSQVTCGGIYSLTDQQGVGTTGAGRVYQNTDLSKYHIYSCEWTETSMVYYIDGNWWSSFVISDDMAHCFRQPHYMLLNLAVGASGGTPSADVTEMKMYVDWVRVYAPIS